MPKREEKILMRTSKPEIVFNLVTGDIFELDKSGIAVLSMCDGETSVSDIAYHTGSPHDEVREFVSDLETLGLVYLFDPDIHFELRKVSQIEIEDEISNSFDLRFNYVVGDRDFKQILVETSFLAPFYLLALADENLIGLSELFLLEELDPDMLFFYQPHLVHAEHYVQNARQIIQEILEKADEFGKKKVEALNISDEGIQKMLVQMGFSESRRVVMWEMALDEHAVSSKLEKNIGYYRRKAEKDNVVIRPLSKEDIPRLAELYRSLGKTKKDLYTVCFGNPAIFEKLLELERFDNDLSLLAEKDGVLLGYHVWVWKDEKTVEWWISRVDHTNPEASTYSVGDLLFTQIVEKARKKGASRASLGWNDLEDHGLCHYKWKWGAIPTQRFIFMRKLV